MNYRHFAFIAALACCGISSAALGEPRAVVELFTSQGCSSCPPADRLMGQFAQDSTLVALSFPVDYWDYLGWKDTLALHGNSTRQRDYATARGDRQVYTPQAVVNGIMHALGSDKAAIENAIAQTHRQAQLNLPVTVAVAGEKVTVRVAAAANATGSAKVWLFPVSSRAEVSIGRGENRGRRLAYYNVVRRWIPLGTWDSKAEEFNVALSELPNSTFSLKEIDRLAVVVQKGTPGKPGVILGATMASLP